MMSRSVAQPNDVNVADLGALEEQLFDAGPREDPPLSIGREIHAPS